jgi:hypothetical protein
MSNILRGSEIPWIFVLIGAFILLGDYIFTGLIYPATVVRSMAVILGGFALTLAAISLTIHHSKRVIERTPGYWYFSVITIVSLWGMTFAGLISQPIGTGAVFTWIFDWFYSQVDRAMFATMAFWIAGAAYRAFKIRSVESTILIVTAVVVLLANASVTETFTPLFTSARTWLFDIPNRGAYRGILISAALGTVALSVRVLMGKERPWE